MLAQLRRLSARNTPAPSRLGQLGEARGNPYMVGHRGAGYRTVALRLPRRPVKPAPLAQLQARAARLRRPRPLRLRRPELHRHHDHAEIPALVELVSRYVLGEAPGLYLPPVAGYARWVLADHLANLEERTPKHRWGQLWRIDDVRAMLGLPRRRRAW